MTNRFPFATLFHEPSEAARLRGYAQRQRAEQAIESAPGNHLRRQVEQLAEPALSQLAYYRAMAGAARRDWVDWKTGEIADDIAASFRSGSLFGLNDGLWGNYDEALKQEQAKQNADTEINLLEWSTEPVPHPTYGNYGGGGWTGGRHGGTVDGPAPKNGLDALFQLHDQGYRAGNKEQAYRANRRFLDGFENWVNEPSSDWEKLAFADRAYGEKAYSHFKKEVRDYEHENRIPAEQRRADDWRFERHKRATKAGGAVPLRDQRGTEDRQGASMAGPASSASGARADRLETPRRGYAMRGFTPSTTRGHPVEARWEPGLPGPSLTESALQRAGYVQAARFRGDVSARHARKILSDLMMPRQRQPLEITLGRARR